MRTRSRPRTCSAASAIFGAAPGSVSGSIRARIRPPFSACCRSGTLNSASPASSPPMISDDPLWYKDVVTYEAHVKAFFDANDDGVGDFKGLRARLDYLQDLGVTAVWLLPFYPSPLRDD